MGIHDTDVIDLAERSMRVKKKVLDSDIKTDWSSAYQRLMRKRMKEREIETLATMSVLENETFLRWKIIQSDPKGGLRACQS